LTSIVQGQLEHEGYETASATFQLSGPSGGSGGSAPGAWQAPDVVGPVTVVLSVPTDDCTPPLTL
jgi:hypothetical protein